MKPRRALTLTELLVVIAVIAVLIALLLPSIQAARESARRTFCANNASQLVKAVHTYEQARNQMPPYFGTDHHIRSKSSWYVFLLPFLDSEALYQEMEGTDGELTETITTPATPPGPDCQPAVPGIWVATEKFQTVPGTGSSSTSDVSIPRPGFGWQEQQTTVVPPEKEWVTLDPPEEYANRTSPVGDTKGYWKQEPKKAQGNCGSSGSSKKNRTGFSGKYVALNMRFESLHCLSDPDTRQTYHRTYGEMALTNYQANFHAFTVGVKNPWANEATKPARMGAISNGDGLSNTIFFAEGHRVCNPYKTDWGVRFAFWATREHQAFGMDWQGRPNTYMFQSRPPAQDCNSWRMQAMHGSSLIAAFGDGSVRPIANAISRAEHSNPDDATPGAIIDWSPDYEPQTWDRLMLAYDHLPVDFE